MAQHETDNDGKASAPPGAVGQGMEPPRRRDTAVSGPPTGAQPVSAESAQQAAIRRALASRRARASSPAAVADAASADVGRPSAPSAVVRTKSAKETPAGPTEAVSSQPGVEAAAPAALGSSDTLPSRRRSSGVTRSLRQTGRRQGVVRQDTFVLRERRAALAPSSAPSLTDTATAPIAPSQPGKPRALRRSSRKMSAVLPNRRRLHDRSRSSRTDLPAAERVDPAKPTTEVAGAQDSADPTPTTARPAGDTLPLTSSRTRLPSAPLQLRAVGPGARLKMPERISSTEQLIARLPSTRYELEAAETSHPSPAHSVKWQILTASGAMIPIEHENELRNWNNRSFPAVGISHQRQKWRQWDAFSEQLRSGTAAQQAWLAAPPL